MRKLNQHLFILTLFLSLVLQNCGQPNQEFGSLEISSARERVIDTNNRQFSSSYGPFVTASGASVTLCQKEDIWTAMVEETSPLVREQQLVVGCAGDIAKVVSQLRHQPTDYVKSQIHVLTPAQSPTGKGAVYLGKIGLSGGMEQDEEKDDASSLPPLHQAAQAGDLAAVKDLVEEKRIDVNALDDFERTALHLATEAGHLAVIRYLVDEKGADVNVIDDEGRAVLHLASEAGHLAVIKYLVDEKGIDVNMRDSDESIALHYAAQGGHLAVVKYLVEEKKADVNALDKFRKAILHHAVKGGNLAVVKYLVEKGGVDVNAQNVQGTTALHWATIEGDLQVIRYLVEVGRSDVNASNNWGTTALHWATQKGYLAVVKYLVEEGEAGVDIRDCHGKTALHWAAQEGHMEMIEYLVEKGEANVSACDNRRRTALHWASEAGHLAAIKYLVGEKEIDINARDNDEKTALHWAAQKGHLEIILYLIEEAKGKCNLQIIEHPEHACFEQWENISLYAQLTALADMLYSKEDLQVVRPEEISAITDTFLKLKLAYKGQEQKPSKECAHDLVTAFRNRFSNRIHREGVPKAMLLDPEGYFRDVQLPESLEMERQAFIEQINAGRELYILHASSLIALLEENEKISSTPLSFILCPPSNFKPYDPENQAQRRTVEFYTQRSTKLARLVGDVEDVERDCSFAEIEMALCKYLLTYLSQLEPYAEIVKVVQEDSARKDLIVSQIESMLAGDDVLLPVGAKEKLSYLLEVFTSPDRAAIVRLPEGVKS